MMRFFCLILTLLGLGACGDTDATPTTILSGKSCGEILLIGNPPRPIGDNYARAAVSCLAHGFQICNAVSLTIRETDTNVIRQFSVAPGGASCSIRQALQTDPNSPPAVVDCESALVENGALVVKACSHLGDFILTP